MSDDPLLKCKVIAARLGVTEPTVRRLAATGKLTEVRVGERSVRYTAESLNQYLVSIGAIQPEPTPAAQP